MNLYTRLPSLKRKLGIIPYDADAALVEVLGVVSQRVENYCGRSFAATVATRTFDGNGTDQLWVPDLVSVTTLKVDVDGDATYELTLVADTDYWLWPDNPQPNEPYRRIDLNPLSAQLTTWPKARRRVQIAGTWGFSYETESLTATVQDNPLSAGGTALTVSAGHDIDVGDMLKIESEQLYVSAVGNANRNILTVRRAQNGTTGASHALATAISRRRYPRVVEGATEEWANRVWWGLQTGSMGAADLADGVVAGGVGRSSFAAIRGELGYYRRDLLKVGF